MNAPREALRVLAGDFLELPDHGMDVYCCGGGGLLQAANNDMRLAIVNRRLSQAVELGAEVMVSACPACKLAFVDGVRASDLDIEVLDLFELAARQMDLL
jgi:Fe-S oxidoreductase